MAAITGCNRQPEPWALSTPLFLTVPLLQVQSMVTKSCDSSCKTETSPSLLCSLVQAPLSLTGCRDSLHPVAIYFSRFHLGHIRSGHSPASEPDGHSKKTVHCLRAGPFVFPALASMSPAPHSCQHLGLNKCLLVILSPSSHNVTLMVPSCPLG